MKIYSIALISVLSFSTANAVGFRELVNKISGNTNVQSAVPVSEPAADIENDAALAAFLEDLEAPAPAADEGSGRDLQNCPTPDVRKWYPEVGSWPNGKCEFTRACGGNQGPGFSTNLACCKGAYGGQWPTRTCLENLESPPTTSPTSSSLIAVGGGLPFYYADYDTPWTVATCINKAPYPELSGRPKYSSMLACCKGAYGGQMSGDCLAALPTPPTTSPTISGGVVDFFYPDYDTAWSEAGCLNDAPLPYPRKADRPSYDTMLSCCKGAYGGQMSGTCLANLPSPPTTSPTNSGGILDFYYPDYDTAWAVAGCSNEAPLPYPRKADRPSYDTMDACCTGSFGGQMSGKCVSGWCKTGDNNGYLKFLSWADADKLEKAHPAIKGGIIMDQEQLDAEFCIEKDVSIVSSGAQSLAGASPFISEEDFYNTTSQDEIKMVCFAKCSKNEDCDYLNVLLFSPEVGGGGSCYLYSYAANKPVFKLSPAVDDHITAAIALRKTTKDVSTRDSAEVECDVPGDALKLQAAVGCGFGQGCTPELESLMTPDLAELIMPAFVCVQRGGADPAVCLGCLLTQTQDNCDAESLCRTPDPLVIHGPCAASCIFLPGAENCVAVIEKAVLCATGARRTSYLYTDPNTFVAEIVLGGGCVNSGYDATTPRFTCPSE